MEGKVIIASETPRVAPHMAVDASSSIPDVVALLPVQRVIFAPSARARLDFPPLESITAWRKGQIALDDASLADAVAEMNRYARRKLIVSSPRAGEIRVSGIFRVGDSDSFAQAVATMHGFVIVREASRIILRDQPTVWPSAQRTKEIIG